MDNTDGLLPPARELNDYEKNLASVSVSETPDIDQIVNSVHRRVMVVFFMVDVSTSMQGASIGAVNDAIRNVILEVGRINATSSQAEIRVAILKFSTHAVWETREPQSIENFKFEDMTIIDGGTNYSRAIKELNGKLSASGFLSSTSGRYMPAVIFLSDCKPSDQGPYERALKKIKENPWFKHANKAAIAIMDHTKEDFRRYLIDFTSDESKVFEAQDAPAIARQINLVTTTMIFNTMRQGSPREAADDYTAGGIYDDEAILEEIRKYEEQLNVGVVHTEELLEF
jgi:uncharacterized protein YegL